MSSQFSGRFGNRLGIHIKVRSQILAPLAHTETIRTQLQISGIDAIQGWVDGKPLSQEAVSVIDLQSVTPSPNETEDADKTKSAVVSFPTKR